VLEIIIPKGYTDFPTAVDNSGIHCVDETQVDASLLVLTISVAKGIAL
jgi:hypothetical protein